MGDRQSSRGRTITEADIVNWCWFTADWFWLHSDETSARRSRYGGRIAPGLMVYAFATGPGVPADSRTIVANYGTDRIRYPCATRIGDTIHLDAEVLALDVRADDPGLAILRWDAVNQHGDTVCASVLKVLLNRSDALPGAG